VLYATGVEYQAVFVEVKNGALFLQRRGFFSKETFDFFSWGENKSAGKNSLFVSQ